MSSKRYFFVHLAIFAGLCGAFVLAGMSNYQEYLAAVERTRTPSAAPATAPAPDTQVPVLALSGLESD
jgi:hypothetical protein